MSVKLCAQNLPEYDSATTITYTFVFEPVRRSVSEEVSPTQSIYALAPGSWASLLVAHAFSAALANIPQNVWYE